MPPEPPELAAFAGDWTVMRQIDDALAAQRYAGEGLARFRSDPQGGLAYDEELRLYLPGQAPLTGRQRYLWRADGDAGIAVLFADGRAFHRIAAGTLNPEDSHTCPPDLYRGAYDFSAWPVWIARWEATGPRKSYRMETRYSPAGQSM